MFLFTIVVLFNYFFFNALAENSNTITIPSSTLSALQCNENKFNYLEVLRNFRHNGYECIGVYLSQKYISGDKYIRYTNIHFCGNIFDKEDANIDNVKKELKKETTIELEKYLIDLKSLIYEIEYYNYDAEKQELNLDAHQHYDTITTMDIVNTLCIPDDYYDQIVRYFNYIDNNELVEVETALPEDKTCHEEYYVEGNEYLNDPFAYSTCVDDCVGTKVYKQPYQHGYLNTHLVFCGKVVDSDDKNAIKNLNKELTVEMTSLKKHVEMRYVFYYKIYKGKRIEEDMLFWDYDLINGICMPENYRKIVTKYIDSHYQ